MPNFTDKLSILPESVKNFVKHLVDSLQPEQVILFGSRARGDHRDNSDFDISIRKEKLSPQSWAKILVDLEEEPFTLHSVDLVHFEEMGEDYQKNIGKEGIILYG